MLYCNNRELLRKARGACSPQIARSPTVMSRRATNTRSFDGASVASGYHHTLGQSTCPVSSFRRFVIRFGSIQHMPIHVEFSAVHGAFLPPRRRTPAIRRAAFVLAAAKRVPDLLSISPNSSVEFAFRDGGSLKPSRLAPKSAISMNKHRRIHGQAR